ncbi:MAG: UDP-N-acetylmuramoyl-tripeptide--D-alanyl-D-alanine ligase [Clostridia bacterium]|nr:UDP-N-acetylmuramoyl-tripeptide--D-alanyl-D-alanine ligase [Clostridia bacterium]
MNKTDIVYIILYTIVAVIHLWVIMTGSLRHETHMLQLNSYFNKRYINYLKKNKLRIFDFKAIVALLGYVFLIFGSFPSIAAYALIYILIDMVKPKTAEKKPLVVTDRVKRLFITEGIITGLIIVSGLFVPRMVTPVLLCLAALLAPLVTILSNLINAPFEAAVRKKFINNAKEKLKAMPDLKIIGITGSYGKTSVKNYVSALLGEKYNVLMTPHSYNTTLGVVRTVNEFLTPLHEVFVVEMGARQEGDIKEICDLVKPRSGILTSIGPQHLETFKTQENIINTKYELIDSVGEGKKFLNYDSEDVRSREKTEGVITYGTTPDCDYWAENIKSTPQGSTFTLVTQDGKFDLATKLLGRHNVVNLTGSCAVALEYGVSIDDIKIAMRRIESVEHRLEIKKQPDCTIIDDAYNSNPQGAKSALETLRDFEGCRIVITPGMVELGDREEEENEKLGAICAECADYAIFVGEKQYGALKKGADTIRPDDEKIICVKDIYEAFNVMRSINGENKIVLLENDLPDNYL